jgi:hypothetical protein
VEGVEGEDLEESREDAGDFLIREDAGVGQARVVIDGNVERFRASAFVAVGAVAGAADAGFVEASEFLDIEVDDFAGSLAFVADDGRGFRQEIFHTTKAVAFEDAIDGGPRNRDEHRDLGVAFTLATKTADLALKMGSGFAGLASRLTRAIEEPLRETLFFHSIIPASSGAFAHSAGRCCGPQSEPKGKFIFDHLRSTKRSKACISVHVVRAVWL